MNAAPSAIIRKVYVLNLQTGPEEHDDTRMVSESCAETQFGLGTDKTILLNFKTSFTYNSH